MNIMPCRSLQSISCIATVKNGKVNAPQQAKTQMPMLSKSTDTLTGASSQHKWTSSNGCKSWSMENFKRIPKTWFNVHAVGIVLGTCILFPFSAYLVDFLKTWTCLIGECRSELARCVADPSCSANLACLEICNGSDEIECQLKCGDLFQNSVVDQFNDCVISRKQCVAQKSDDGRFHVPPPCALVHNFKTTDFTGKWFISSGLNTSFDMYDCQVHELFATPGKLQANLTWRVNTPDGGFFTRKTVQRLTQDTKNPVVLHNHDNELLHYKEDWYILSSKIEDQPDDYILIYYKGSNDAWDGYGGAVVYTRSTTLPSSIVPTLEAATKNVGLHFEAFKMTNNSCNPMPPLLTRLKKKMLEGGQPIVKKSKEFVAQVQKKAKSIDNIMQVLMHIQL